MAETLTHRATLKGHAGWVTAIATPLDPASDVLLTASRDKTVLVWHLEVRTGFCFFLLLQKMMMRMFAFFAGKATSQKQQDTKTNKRKKNTPPPATHAHG